MDHFSYMVFFWKFNENYDHKNKAWTLCGSARLDLDGHIVASDIKIKSVERWVYKDGNHDEPIPGTMITIWNVESGVKLYRFHPPKNNWVENQFNNISNEFCKLPNPFAIIADGSYVQGRTARLVEDLLFPS